MIKKMLSLLLAGALLLLASCNNNKQPVPDLPETEPREEFSEETTTSAPATGANDTTWRMNYDLKYTYIHQGAVSTITERRTNKDFVIVDDESGITVYYTQGVGNTIDCYTLMPEKKTGKQMTQTDAQMQDLNSPFVTLSFVSPEFTGFANVEFMADETVAGRSAKQYKQTAKDAQGIVTQYLYVWIDTELGFASKCSICKADGTIEKAWELLEFRTGDVAEDAVKPDIGSYKITKQEA